MEVYISEFEQYMTNQIALDSRAMLDKIDILEQAANGVAISVEELQAKSERDRAELEREIKSVIAARLRIEDDLLAINKELMDDKQLLINNIKKRKSSGNTHTHTPILYIFLMPYSLFLMSSVCRISFILNVYLHLTYYYCCCYYCCYFLSTFT